MHGATIKIVFWVCEYHIIDVNGPRQKLGQKQRRHIYAYEKAIWPPFKLAFSLSLHHFVLSQQAATPVGF
jgi:hypothetical protein